jgi:hypothetical protein
MCWLYFRRHKLRIKHLPPTTESPSHSETEVSDEAPSEPTGESIEIEVESPDISLPTSEYEEVLVETEETPELSQLLPTREVSLEISEPDRFELQVPQTQNRIVTRTTKGDGRTRETWVGEMKWPPEKEARALHQLGRGLSPQVIAIELKVDLKDVVYLAARKIYKCEGDLESTVFAFKDRRRWSKSDLELLKRLRAEGQSVSAISLELGRTQLAVVWQLLERGA